MAKVPLHYTTELCESESVFLPSLCSFLAGTLPFCSRSLLKVVYTVVNGRTMVQWVQRCEEMTELQSEVIAIVDDVQSSGLSQHQWTPVPSEEAASLEWQWEDIGFDVHARTRDNRHYLCTRIHQSWSPLRSTSLTSSSIFPYMRH